ncbi:terpenoid cyclases/protein prenyltransferase alpha-alpha toroid [Chytriomyces sp. MP71]|nr:terpenoid cyclases/protein prenyltransferase alpha-alpha toroid [Chytriomyces sp. MP71]
MDNRWGLNDDGVPTDTSTLQTETEDSIFALLSGSTAVPHQTNARNRRLVLSRTAHIRFLKGGLKGLSRNFVSLDASKPWILFWILHALDLLGETLSDEDKDRAINTLSRCQHSSGGFGGGPGQLAHLATTYAAVHALAILGTHEAFDAIDRTKLYSWILSLKQSSGAYIMHYGGEVDVRGSYCVASVCKLLCMLTPDVTANMGVFIASCQTYEGGIGSVQGVEAHGGYTFCAVAAMEILAETSRLNLGALAEWTVSRQMEMEGGFQGRTNKLVDGCYSFWVGGIFFILAVMSLRQPGCVIEFSLLMTSVALQEYVLICCQAPKGGLRDKPEKHPDFYHSCYCLSGLSISQHTYTWSADLNDFIVTDSFNIVGVYNNKLPATHPVHNIRMEYVTRITGHFSSLVE